METAKERAALACIDTHLCQAVRPIVLCSFGKDSIVLLHLCLRIRKLPVMCFRLSRFHEKHDHGHEVMKTLDLEVFEGLPSNVVEFYHGDFFEFMHIYRTGYDQITGQPGCIVLSTGTRPRTEQDERYFCGWDDLMMRPKGLMEWPWDVTFHGQKSTDDVEIGQMGKITKTSMACGNTRLVWPLHDWTDADVWEYIEKHDVPYDRHRYVDKDTTSSPDSYPTCATCLDPRTQGEEVWCPKVGHVIPSRARSQEDMERTRQDIIAATGGYLEVKGDARTTPNLAHA